MAVTANITVSFGADGAAGAGSHLSAEIDSREDGLNGGDTSFAPGDTAYFLVYQSANVTHDRPVVSAGAVIDSSVGTITREEDISFADEDTASLQVPAVAITGVTWLGRSLGDLTLLNEQDIKASAKGVAVARVTYAAAPSAYGVQAPSELAGETDFSILAFVQGHES